MQSGLYASRRQAARLYTLRGMLYASALYPILTCVLFAIASVQVTRPRWRAPHIRR